jgi:hypothetical protein
VQHIIVIVFVAVAYAALAGISEFVARSPADAWTVWLASGAVLGLLLAVKRSRWAAVLAGGFIGGTGFALHLGSGILEAAGYGAIEVISAGGAALIVSRLTALPMRFDSARELAALIVAGALPLALLGAVLAAAWHIAAGGGNAVATFRVWAIANFIGTLLVAPMVIAWAQFRPRRSGGMPMPAFAGGAIACALFLGSMWLLFDSRVEDRFGGSVGESLTYVPIVFMALLALLWGTRGATLAAFLGALIAMVNTVQGEGPFAGVEGFLGEAELEVEGYALAIALTGLLIATLEASQRAAMRAARDWQTRFEATIGAHRLLAYEWDPASGQLEITGDSLRLVGVPSTQLRALADWLALVAPDERERVGGCFDARTAGSGEPDTLTYFISGPGGSVLTATDEARVIRDHDGELHRVVSIVRISATASTGDSV